MGLGVAVQTDPLLRLRLFRCSMNRTQCQLSQLGSSLPGALRPLPAGILPPGSASGSPFGGSGPAPTSTPAALPPFMDLMDLGSLLPPQGVEGVLGSGSGGSTMVAPFGSVPGSLGSGPGLLGSPAHTGLPLSAAGTGSSELAAGLVGGAAGKGALCLLHHAWGLLRVAASYRGAALSGRTAQRMAVTAALFSKLLQEATTLGTACCRRPRQGRVQQRRCRRAACRAPGAAALLH